MTTRPKARRNRDLTVAGYSSGVDAPLRATADAMERTRDARSVVLVEGISDQIAVETLAARQGRDLAPEGIVVLPIGGAMAVGRFLDEFGPAGAGLRVSGLCDAAEASYFSRQLKRSGYAKADGRIDLEKQGFFVCNRDLEDELIRAVGSDAIEAILVQQGDLSPFRTLQKQVAWRDAGFVDQFRRFLSAGARRKLRYASLLVEALDIDQQPRPLRDVLARA